MSWGKRLWDSIHSRMMWLKYGNEFQQWYRETTADYLQHRTQMRQVAWVEFLSRKDELDLSNHDMSEWELRKIRNPDIERLNSLVSDLLSDASLVDCPQHPTPDLHHESEGEIDG